MSHPKTHSHGISSDSRDGLAPARPDTRVLVVEDEPSLRHAFAIALEDERWIVETAEDGIAATGKVGERRFDVLLADLRMPGIDGICLIRKMRENRNFTPAMLCTADLGLGDFLAAVQLGVVTFLLKPVSLITLRSVVESALLQRAADPVEIAFEEAEKMNFGRAAEMLGAIASRDPQLELQRWENLFTRIDEGVENVALIKSASLVLDDMRQGRVARPIYAGRQ